MLELEMLQSLRKVGPYILEFDLNQDQPASLPGSLLDKLAVAIVLSRVGLAAQNAQRVYGVPASFLIAQFIMDHGYVDDPQAEEGERFMGELLLLSEAKELATNPQFVSALELAASPVAYARRLCELDFKDNFYFGDVADLIVRHDLFQCDWRYGVLPDFHNRTVEVAEAAAILCESATSIRCMIKLGDLSGHLYGGNDGRDYVIGASIQGYAERRLLQEIKSDGKGKPGPRGKLLDFASTVAPSSEPA